MPELAEHLLYGEIQIELDGYILSTSICLKSPSTSYLSSASEKTIEGLSPSTLSKNIDHFNTAQAFNPTNTQQHLKVSFGGKNE